MCVCERGGKEKGKKKLVSACEIARRRDCVGGDRERRWSKTGGREALVCDGKIIYKGETSGSR